MPSLYLSETNHFAGVLAVGWTVNVSPCSPVDDDPTKKKATKASFDRAVEEWGGALAPLKAWFQYVSVPRGAMLEVLPSVATLDFLGLNDLGNAAAVSRGWLGFFAVTCS